MASTKRIPKRSIIGARVTVKCVDGFWRPGVVAAMRSSPAATLFPGEKKFSVRLEMIGSVLECREAEIVGPGFLTNLPLDTRLLPGQVSPLFLDLTLSFFQVIHSLKNVEINVEETSTFVRTLVLT